MSHNDMIDPNWDAETLARAKEIQSDPARHAAAQTASVQLAREATEKAEALAEVAKEKAGQDKKLQERFNRSPEMFGSEST